MPDLTPSAILSCRGTVATIDLARALDAMDLARGISATAPDDRVLRRLLQGRRADVRARMAVVRQLEAEGMVGVA